MGKLVITIGQPFEAVNRQILENVQRAKAGLPVEVDTRIDFADVRQMLSMLDPGRLDVLSFVAEHRPASIVAIATGVGRSYRRVHADVQALLGFGLLEQQDDGSLCVIRDFADGP